MYACMVHEKEEGKNGEEGKGGLKDFFFPHRQHTQTHKCRWEWNNLKQEMIDN